MEEFRLLLSFRRVEEESIMLNLMTGGLGDTSMLFVFVYPICSILASTVLKSDYDSSTNSGSDSIALASDDS